MSISDLERRLIKQYNLPVMWADYTDHDETKYMTYILPTMLKRLDPSYVEKEKHRCIKITNSNNVYDLLANA